MRALIFVRCLLATPALADVAAVASVIDGDTIEVHGRRVRLHGIDAPESRQLCRLDGNPWQCGKDAANMGRDRYRHHVRSTYPSTSALTPTTILRQRCPLVCRQHCGRLGAYSSSA